MLNRYSLNITPALTIFIMVLALGVFSSGAYGQMAAIAAIDEPEPRGAVGGGGSAEASAGSAASSQTKRRSTATKRQTATNTKSARSTTTAAKTRKAPAKYDGFVVGDKYSFLNFEVVSAEKPYHTRAAKANGAKGLVQVEVLIETNGTVIDAKGRSGNKELWPEAERAALASKFNRPTFGGKPARAIGFLVYRFGPAED